MSLNLVFERRSGALISFPVQTPTEVTLAVLKEPSRPLQLERLDHMLKGWKWPQAGRETLLKRVRDLMEDPDLTLTKI